MKKLYLFLFLIFLSLFISCELLTDGHEINLEVRRKKTDLEEIENIDEEEKIVTEIEKEDSNTIQSDFDEKLVNLEKLILELKGQVTDLKDEKSKSENIEDAAKEIMKGTDEKITGLEDLILKLQEQIDGFQIEISEDKDNEISVAEILNETGERTAKLEELILELQNQITDLRSSDDTKDEITDLENALLELQKKIIALEEEKSKYGDVKELEASAIKAKEAAEKAEKEAKEAEEKAKRSEEAAKKAEDEAIKAKEDANKAESDAKTAEENAKKAETDAKFAEEKAKKAEEDAKKAEEEAIKAKEDANNAESDANTVAENAKKAEEEAKKAQDEAKKAEEEAIKAKEDANKAQMDAKTAEENAKKVEEEAKKAQDEAKKAEEEALKAKEEANNAQMDAKTAEENAKKVEAEAKKAQDEAKRTEEEALKAKEDANNAQMDAKTAEENAKKAESDAKKAEEEAKKAEEEAIKAKEDANNAESDAKKAEEEARKAEKEAIKAKEDANNAESDAKTAEEKAKQTEEEAKKAIADAKEAEEKAKQAEEEAIKAREEAQKSEEKKNDEEQLKTSEELSGSNVNKTKDRVWTILVYMSADNQLESSAIEDLCEMQNSIIDTEEVTILALVDRSNRYNYSNGDWTGTRLYKIKTGNSIENMNIVSTEIDCKPLGLEVGVDKELEMASSYTLSEVLSYVIEKYPAEKNGLIMWGHGTGWRNDKAETISEIGEDNSARYLYKGFAFDETSGTYMTLKQLGTALKSALGSNKLDFIGFDTCFGGEIEVVYELRNSARVFVGTEGLISSSGWNYKKVFDTFSLSGDLSEENLCHSIITQFAQQYTYTPKASICAVKLDYVENYVKAFNNFAALAGNSINSIEEHDKLMGTLYTDANCPTYRYSYDEEGYDIYLDVESLVENLNTYFDSASLNSLYAKFISSQEKAFLESWASDRKSGGLGVYFSTYGAGGILLSYHPAGYISGKTMNQIDFVRDCSGYVPGKITSTGLLDSLFYRDFLVEAAKDE